MSDVNPSVTSIPIGLPTVDNSRVTQRVKAIANLAASKPDLELAEVTATSVATRSITVKKIGTTVTIPAVVQVGWSGGCFLPEVGEFVWIVTTGPGAQPFAIGIVQPDIPRIKINLANNIGVAANVFPGNVMVMANADWDYMYKEQITHDWVTNNTRIIIQRAGLYHIHARIQYEPNNIGQRFVYVYINGGGRIFQIEPTPTAFFSCAPDVLINEELYANDYVEFYYTQNSGGALNIEGGLGKTFIELIKLADLD